MLTNAINAWNKAQDISFKITMIFKEMTCLPNFHIWLLLTNRKVCTCIVYQFSSVINLPSCVSHWHVQPPAVNDNITVLRSVHPRLMVIWQDCFYERASISVFTNTWVN